MWKVEAWREATARSSAWPCAYWAAPYVNHWQACVDPFISHPGSLALSLSLPQTQCSHGPTHKRPQAKPANPPPSSEELRVVCTAESPYPAVGTTALNPCDVRETAWHDLRLVFCLADCCVCLPSRSRLTSPRY